MRGLVLILVIGIGILPVPQHAALAQPANTLLERSQVTDSLSPMRLTETRDAEVSAPDPCDKLKGKGFFGRFSSAYVQHLHDSSESGPEPAYRGVPAALNSPPFPWSTWPIGGTPAIGYPDTRDSPLIDTINCGPGGDFFKEHRIKIFGWLAPGFNASTSTSKFSITSGIGGNF